MKRYLIHVYTNWCGMDNFYSLETDSEIHELHDDVQLIAYENFQSFGCDEYVMEELFPGVSSEDYTDEMWDIYNDSESEYYSYDIEEFEGSDEEFNEYESIW